MRRLSVLLVAVLAVACAGEDWSCVEQGQTLYSVSSSGKIGSADKGCSCAQIRDFEYRNFGSVDEHALAADFGC
ncbi:MAG: hypothetical protein QNJ00_16435 [Woeseiaceae bacterium]|nr:hypothetical protein [Woeseiaceae bacterium]